MAGSAPQQHPRPQQVSALRVWATRKWDWISAKPLRLVLCAVGLVIGVGTIGFMIVGPMGPIDAIYMAVISVTTTGFENLADSPAGRLFASFYILVGVGVGGATVSALAAIVVEGRIREVLGRRRMKREANLLSNHIILCGYGRFGQLAAEQLKLEGIPYVVIDKFSEMVDLAEEHGAVAIQADATEEEAMILAGVDRARALMSVLPTDAENVYTILNAREVRGTRRESDGPDDFAIVVLARDRRAERKLRVAGATYVVQPFEIGAQHMAQQIVAPNVARMMNLASGRGLEAAGIRMREFPVDKASPLVGIALKDSPVRRDFNVMIVGVIEGSDGEPRYNPGPNYVVAVGDVLVAVGPTDGMVKLKEATEAPPSEPNPLT